MNRWHLNEFLKRFLLSRSIAFPQPNKLMFCCALSYDILSWNLHHKMSLAKISNLHNVYQPPKTLLVSHGDARIKITRNTQIFLVQCTRDVRLNTRRGLKLMKRCKFFESCDVSGCILSSSIQSKKLHKSLGNLHVGLAIVLDWDVQFDIWKRVCLLKFKMIAHTAGGML